MKIRKSNRLIIMLSTFLLCAFFASISCFNHGENKIAMAANSIFHSTPVNQIPQVDNQNTPILKEENFLEQLIQKTETLSEKKLSREKTIELYKSGYDFSDIQVAEELSLLCDKTPIELLEYKGKSIYQVNTDDSGNIITTSTSKTWKQVVDELKIKIKKPSEELNVPNEKLEELKAQGFDDNEIETMLLVSYNFGKDLKEILEKIKKGKKIDELEAEFNDERLEISQKDDVDKNKAKENTEVLLKRQYNISEEDIAICNSNGLTNIFEIAFAKDLAIKSNTTLKEVLEVKKQLKEWDKVARKMEVSNK